MSALPISSLAPNVTQAVPFFMVADIQASLRFYIDGLGFVMTRSWTPRGKLQWCWLELGGVALMLQERSAAKAAPAQVGEGVSICFQCGDSIAIYKEASARGLAPRRPFVGNGLWVTPFTDPDGYRIEFSSPTDAPEESEYLPSE
jgi:lactoylglutathione lyase